jgi:predicted RNase H-like HicB family nuclease
MAHYIALIHKDRDSCYGVSFPDLPGVFTAADSIDEAMQKTAEVIEFAAEDWSDLTGEGFRPPDNRPIAVGPGLSGTGRRCGGGRRSLPRQGESCCLISPDDDLHSAARSSAIVR